MMAAASNAHTPGLHPGVASRIERAESKLRALGLKDNGSEWVRPAFNHDAIALLSREAMADRCDTAANSGDVDSMLRALAEVVVWLKVPT